MILKIVSGPIGASYREATTITAWFDGKPGHQGIVRFTGWEHGNQVWDDGLPDPGMEAYIMTSDGRTFDKYHGGPCDSTGGKI